MKTQTSVEQDFYNAMKSSTLAGIVNGSVYKGRIRPLNSTKEDIIIISTALSASQLQSGIITILVYTQGIERDSNILPNLERISQIEEAAILLPDELKKVLTNYNGIALQSGIAYDFDTEIEQYFVSIKINYSYLT